MCLFAAIGGVVMSSPQITAVPAVGARNPVIIFIVVDLPAPFGPRNPNTSPAGTLNDTLSTATTGPNFLTRLRISSIPSLPRAGGADISWSAAAATPLPGSAGFGGHRDHNKQAIMPELRHDSPSRLDRLVIKATRQNHRSVMLLRY